MSRSDRSAARPADASEPPHGPDSLPEPLRRSLRRTAGAACELAAEHLERVVTRLGGRPEARRKGHGDFVTALDDELERRIDDFVRAARPDDGFVGEETGVRTPGADFVWVVDPIDGTSNFAAGLAHFAVSVACLHAGHPVAAAAHTWPDRETITAAAGLGAAVGRRRLRLDGTQARAPDAAILGVQWLRDRRGASWEFVRALQDSGGRIRISGSSVTQICDVARGRLDANLQEQGKIWDIAAAALIAHEAGARCTDWHGREIFPVEIELGRAATELVDFPTLIAPPADHRRLLRLLAETGPGRA